MVLYGAKEQTADIDLGCTSQLADQLQQKGCAVERMPDGTRRIVYDEQVEIFENWLEDQVVLWEGVPVISRKGLVFMKRKLGREKDFRDIALLRQACSFYRGFSGRICGGLRCGRVTGIRWKLRRMRQISLA